MRHATIGLIVLNFLSVGCAGTAMGEKFDVMALVQKTCLDVRLDAPGTFAKITAGEHPYADRENPALYVFVYDEGVNVVAHPDRALVGKCLKGVPDAAGKKFRAELVATALGKGAGWVDYVYKKPGAEGVFPKSTYAQRAAGSDGRTYAVCCGLYREAEAPAPAAAKSVPVNIGLSETDAGRALEVSKGGLVTVVLDSNPTTGFHWEVSSGAGSVLVQEGETEFRQPETGGPPLVGSGGTETFRFRASQAGASDLLLVYRRPWEKGVPPVRTFAAKVTVQ